MVKRWKEIDEVIKPTIEIPKEFLLSKKAVL